MRDELLARDGEHGAQDARIADAAAVVDREANREGVDYRAVARVAHRVTALQHMAHVAVADLAAADSDLGLDHARRSEPRREADHDRLDPLVRHLLGGVNGGADRFADLIEVDDCA